MDISNGQIHHAVVEALQKEKNGYLNIKALITGPPAEIKQKIGFSKNVKTKDFTAKEALNRLIPHLEKEVIVYTKGNLIYLSLDSKDRMILRRLQHSKSLPTFKMLRKNVTPLLNQIFTETLNDMLLSGKVICTFRGDNPVISIQNRKSERVFQSDDPGEISINDENKTEDDSMVFQMALKTIGKGRRLVYIYQARRFLTWSRQRFDQLIRKLRGSYEIQLHGGDPSVMTEDEVRDSFLDEKGILYVSVSWRGK